ncbi:hypothetical protein I4U23_028095, partial [Adineta vaga]
CLNGGTCVDLINGYQCLCPPVYSGTNCLRLQDQCTGFECLNGGKCIRNGTALMCLCAQGYQGDNCELLVDYCQSQPCQNGGICSNTDLGPQCSCPNGITGLFCETIIDQCQSQPCQNNGTCKSLINQYVCLCPSGLIGTQCETERNECEPVNPCLNSGRCIDLFNNFSCICNPGFTGFYCEIQIDYCQSNPCLNGGICRTLINGYKCDCLEGYNGTRCSTVINYCLSNPCLNNGLCISLLNGYRCICLDDYLGLQCENKSNECLLNPCLNNGTCIDKVWNYTCQCLPGYTGSNCHLLVDYCLSSPCINGLCQNRLNGYDCICPSSSYTGVRCEVQINKCASNPCQSNATCIDGLDRFVCLCPAWFSGITCTEQINPCLNSKTCANNATCLVNYDVKPHGYTCQCLPGFTGDMCEIDIDDCATQPCRRGQCIDRVNGFICSCYSGGEGVLCENDVNFCLSAPCLNNGTCTLLTNGYQCRCVTGFQGINCEQSITQPCLSSPCFYCETQLNPCSYYPCAIGTSLVTSPITCQCQCPYAYTGALCQINVCQTNPCLTGNCIANGNYSYTCNCPVGFQYMMGVCADINECTTIPGICANGGRCINSYGSYICFCNSGFFGTNCEIYEPCRALPCINGGTCASMGTYPFWQCICPTLYTGSRCEITSLGCSSNPCRTGTCTSLANGGYQCFCPPLLTGINCDIPSLPCASNPCLNNATCLTLSLTNYTCICPPRYTGLTCSQQIIYCPVNPCQGNSTCIINPITGLQICQCPPERYGVYCEILSPCGSNPCVQGICQNRNSTSFVCICETSYTNQNDEASRAAVSKAMLRASCEVPYNVCSSNPCLNGGSCISLGNGFYTCICATGFTGTNCNTPLCRSDSCFNAGTCLIQDSALRCQCPCGFTGSRCETPFDICSLSLCQNNGTRILNATGCRCTCLCPSTFTGNLCQTPITPVNTTYPGQIVIPVDRPGGSSWELILQCIDQVWNSLNVILVCSTPFTLVSPTTFYPYCYQINQQSSLVSQINALQDCSDKSAQLVWFQSIDEIQQQLIPALFARGLARDFWTSGIYSTTLNRWQWLLSNNNTRIDIDSSILTQFGITSSVGQSIFYSFAQLTNRQLTTGSSSQTYSTLCKISATRLPLDNQTRAILQTSQQYGYQNQTQVIIYNFNYTIFSTIPSNVVIQQPTAAQYAAMCGAIGNPTGSVDPYIIDICGYFPSINDGNVQLLMQTISAYYTAHRISLLSTQSYVAIPLRVEHFATISGDLMTRIRFIITSGSSTVLGSNIEPLASVNDILNSVNYRIYQQCTPYISLNILLPLKLCIPFNEISLWTNLIANAVSAATGQSNVVVMLKGVQAGVTSTGQPANTAYFLITINGMTYNQTLATNLTINPILLSTITQANNQLLCSNQTQIIPYQNSIQDFHISCPIPQILQRRLNNALQQAGIYTMNMTIFGVEEAVDNLGQIYRLPNIYIQHQNGTWLDSPLQLNNQLYQILISVQMQRILTRIYRLSKAYSYFYSNSLTINDREYLQRLILATYNQQSSITSNNVKVLLEDTYLNTSSLATIQRIYAFLFYNDQELDGRYLSALILSPSQFAGPYYSQIPLTYISNIVPNNIVKQRDVQQITFTGKISRTLAQASLVDYWQNPIRQGLTNSNVYILQLQQYFVYSSNQFFTTITYIVLTSDGYTVPSACFNPNLIQSLNGLCDSPNTYVTQIPFTYTASFVDLRGNSFLADLTQDNFGSLLTSALQRTGISSTVSSFLVEARFGFDMSLVTRIYYVIVPNQVVTQEQIQVQLKSIFSTMQPIKYDLYPTGQLSVARSDAHQYIANVTLPLTSATRREIENYLTSYNRQYGTAKIVYAETLNANQTRFYLVFQNDTQILTRCDFSLYYPGVTNLNNGTGGVYSIYLERNVFVAQPIALADGLAQIWMNQNVGIQPGTLIIQLQNQVQYICSGGKKSFRIDYIVQSLLSNVNVNNLIPPPNSAFDQLYGKFVNTSHCIPYQAYWIYLIEPRSSNEIIRTTLENAWRQSNNNLMISVSSQMYFDSTYLTNNNQTLTRVTYTINLNGSDLSSLTVTQPSINSIILSNLYTNIPYKRFSLYIDGSKINLTSSTTLSMLNQALRNSWALANSYLFSANDILIPSISSTLANNGQTKVDYMIGLRSGDIGDYSQPSERLYTQIFNQTGLQTLVYTRYIPTKNNQVLINSDESVNVPFYRRSGPFFGLDWWIILILVVGILTLWLIICLIFYVCCRQRAERNSSVIVQDIHHAPNDERIYGAAIPPATLSKRSISVIDLQDQPSTIEFRRPRRTSRSVSPSGSFRYILPFNSHREQKQRHYEPTSLGNRQDIPISVMKSPMYSEDSF